MTTRETAQILASAAEHFPFLCISDAKDLLDVVRWELGHEDILDGFQNYAQHRAMAFAPASILHIISGNTPHAGLQSLIRGLLLKAHNFCKIPSGGLPEIAEFRDALPAALAAQIEISSDLPDEWLARAEALIVFGGGETIAHFQKLARTGQRFVAHGHKVSLGIIFDDPTFESVSGAARDASLFDQQGCLSPHVFYVGGPDARKYAARLAHEMEVFNGTNPRAKISAQESAAIQNVRDDFEFRAANGGGAEVWKSAGGTDWTVVFDTNPNFAASCLNRVIFVKPLPHDITAAVAEVRAHLSTVAIFPASPENAEKAAEIGSTRVCAVGRMQNPHFTWHQDGAQNLAPLVRWIDFEQAPTRPPEQG
jgi:hypothetical protein